MRILFAASEVAPEASTGGLGEVIAALPRFVAGKGHEVAVALPGYPALMDLARELDVHFEIPIGGVLQPVSIFELLVEDGTQLLLVHNEALFGRPGIYGDGTEAYPDNALRYVFFSRAVVELAKRLEPTPSVLHLHDWQTALVPALVKEQRLPLKTVLSLHNLAYQGAFHPGEFAHTGLPQQWMQPSGYEFHGGFNLLKGGILHADLLTTVSETYRREMLTPAGGFGLNEVLQAHREKLHVVPNGVDSQRWNPQTDALLKAGFSAADTSGKSLCRAALLNETALRPDPKGPVFAMLGRLADQKGFDLLLPLLPRLFADDTRLVIAGDGSPALRKDLLVACREHPGKLAFLPEWDLHFPQRLFAGADVLLVPSHFEPCGLAPLQAMRFGTVPVAHATGGLRDNLQDFEPATGVGNALLYRADSSAALWDTIVRAGVLFQDKSEWKRIVLNAMRSEFSWDAAAAAADVLYRRLNS